MPRDGQYPSPPLRDGQYPSSPPKDGQYTSPPPKNGQYSIPPLRMGSTLVGCPGMGSTLVRRSGMGSTLVRRPRMGSTLVRRPGVGSTLMGHPRLGSELFSLCFSLSGAACNGHGDRTTDGVWASLALFSWDSGSCSCEAFISPCNYALSLTVRFCACCVFCVSFFVCALRADISRHGYCIFRCIDVSSFCFGFVRNRD